MITAVAGQAFTAAAEDAGTGLVGMISVKIEDGDGNPILAETTVGIVEIEPGVYSKDDLTVATAGYYVVIWDDGSNTATEELRVLATASVSGLGMASGLINRPCVIVRRLASATTDVYGNEIPDEDLVETVCEIQQRRREEPEGSGELSSTEWLGFFPAGADLKTGDVVLADADEYELTGDPWHARNPRTGVESHVEASLVLQGATERVS